MKKLFVTMGFILFALALKAQQQTAEAAVQQTITRFFDGIAGLDTTLIQQCIASNFVLLEDGAVWNTDTLMAKVQQLKTLNPTRTNQLQFLRTAIQDNVGWVSYYNSAVLTINNQKIDLNWLESAVLLREAGKWKISLLHSTVLKKP